MFAENAKGSIVKGKVVSVEQSSLMVELAEGVEAMMRASELSIDKKVEDARTATKEGEELEVKITAIDRKKTHDCCFRQG